MDLSSLSQYLDTLMVQPDRKISLKKDFETDYDHKMMTKEEGEKLLQTGIENLALMQDKLYAHNRHSILIVLQAMDAAGKDSAIKHVMSGLNPQGVKVTSFKTPSKEELDHDYLWRHFKALPARGEIGIFNRSHYENVLVTRVHPEYILNENIPGVETVEHITEDFWQQRFRDINRFEKYLSDNGTLILKFFLHVSKKEQKKRFIERIDDPAKNWKFAAGDVAERAFWDDYMKAYDDMLEATSKANAPWFILPADDKWFTRLCLAAIISREFDKLDASYPRISEEQKKELALMREKLINEPE
ncbi:polyphosphate kinase 2 family protein [Flavihumibacter stibioxidans]|uniref:Polyphosphate--nucleotide phosphotransferase n=1 Tax=Flavihumibacter stibioxidans TaxID=1834163 RepID=A0ABR7MBZ8_9BACT|nr:polyphosphate kinase 2 family protein [Flavihumibacter stibioxidans]MBC6492482.1 polyphosphate--nucleotide phosphotransferase [Flavihumibacter stibioxidans]